MINDPSRSQNEMPASQPSDEAVEQLMAQDAGSSEQETANSPAAADLDEELARLAEELEAANERTIRAHAELENFRKRVYREMEDERKYAGLPLLRSLLPVLDNLQRAILAAEQTPDVQGLLEGVKLVSQQLDNVLQQHHCKRIDAKGKLFDPHLHEAIAQFPSQEVPRGAVIDVTQAGYLLHDRVVRASQVLVSAGPPVAADPASD
jgi:molecular chaperone GrpE